MCTLNPSSRNLSAFGNSFKVGNPPVLPLSLHGRVNIEWEGGCSIPIKGVMVASVF